MWTGRYTRHLRFHVYKQSCNNLALKYDEAGKKVTQTISATKNTWIDLTCLSIKRCLLNGEVYDNYLYENGQIKFPITKDFDIEYITYHDKVTALVDTPGIHEAFHEAIAYYVAYREMTRIFMHEDLTEGNNKTLLLAEYNREAELASAKLRTMKKSRQRIKYAPMI